MSTPHTLSSSDAPGDRASRVPGAADPAVSDPTGLVIDPTGLVIDPTGLVIDLKGLVIDLTLELDVRRSRAPDRTSVPKAACRALRPDQLARTAAIHAGELPDGFFVRFGPRFLAAYHGTFLSGPASVGLVVGSETSPTGFVVGTLDNPRHYRWLLRNAGPMVRTGLMALATRPRLAAELLRSRSGRYLRSVLRLVRQRRSVGRGELDAASGSATPEVPVVAVLTHVAVASHAQGSGLGRQLVDAFVQRARDHGAEEVRLIAHADTPAPAFYRRLGWVSLGERLASDGRLVEEFKLVL